MTVATQPAPSHDLAPRTASLDPSDFPVPTGREEEWRFAPMDRFRSFLTHDPNAGAVRGEGGELVRNVGPSEASDWLPTDLPAAIARAGISNVVIVDIPANAELAEPIVVRLAADAPTAYQHVEVRAGAFSKATVLLEQSTVADISGAIVVHVGDSASLEVVCVLDSPGRYASCWSTTIGRDANFVGCAVTIAGSAVRILPSVHYAGPGGRAELLGVFLADGDQYLEHRIFVDHDQPNCTSNVVYKGALSGPMAHTVWVGDVLVRRAATGINTYEMNRNLLLTEGPRADSVPNLELETGNVEGAGHASATGRFDEEQLFYLQARGIPEDVARQLVVRGFFADVLGRLRMKDRQKDIIQRISTRLGLGEAEVLDDDDV